MYMYSYVYIYVYVYIYIYTDRYIYTGGPVPGSIYTTPDGTSITRQVIINYLFIDVYVYIYNIYI